jgi:hypothetical protein
MNTIYNRFFYTDPTGIQYPHSYSQNILAPKYGWKPLAHFSWDGEIDFKKAKTYLESYPKNSLVLMDVEGDYWRVTDKSYWEKPNQVGIERWKRLLTFCQAVRPDCDFGPFRIIPQSECALYASNKEWVDYSNANALKNITMLEQVINLADYLMPAI